MYQKSFFPATGIFISLLTGQFLSCNLSLAMKPEAVPYTKEERKLRKAMGSLIVSVRQFEVAVDALYAIHDMEPVPLRIRCSYFKGDEIDGFKVAIRENRFRNQTTPLDDAYNIAQLKRWGQTEEEIASLYQQDVKWIRSREKLVELTPEAKAALKSGRLKAPAAVKLAKMSANAQREAVAGEGKVKIPKAKGAKKPAERVTVVKAQARHKTLVEIEKALLDMEVFNRDKVLKLIRSLAEKAEAAAKED